MRIASSASGMPFPRMRSEPYRAISPMISAPATGTTMESKPSEFTASAGMVSAKENV
jgi:hypothetical protein